MKVGGTQRNNDAVSWMVVKLCKTKSHGKLVENEEFMCAGRGEKDFRRHCNAFIRTRKRYRL